MEVGIIGLGLIGGSLAKAYEKAGATVLGIDIDDLVTQYAMMAGAIDGVLTKDYYKDCDLILVAIPPVPAVNWIRENAKDIPKETILIDCCGTKRIVCDECFKIADEHGLTYMGGHPMAGHERGGFKHSSADLFQDAPFILVPRERNDMALFSKVKEMLMMAGFGRVSISTADDHDKVIAFTSQMPHVVSNGFIKSKTALNDSQMLSAGSYQDFTRVACLDENMWTELFMENKDYLSQEIGDLIEELAKYKKAMDDDDEETLRTLLKQGREAKDAVLEKCGPAQIYGD